MDEIDSTAMFNSEHNDSELNLTDGIIELKSPQNLLKFT